jgi:putative flippase GtrA
MRALIAQVIRFGIAGGVVAIVYLTLTTSLHLLIGLPFQVALVIGYATALIIHFSLQRRFVWRAEAYALSVRSQAARYVPVAAAQYGVTAVATAFLPGALAVSVTVVYVATVVVVTSANFVVFRWAVFHSDRSAFDPGTRALK